MPQQAADQVHIHPGRIERFHGKTVPRHMHGEREREAQLPADPAQQAAPAAPQQAAPAMDPAETKFCSECGFRLETNTCPGCGGAIKPGMKFCPECGRSLR